MLSLRGISPGDKPARTGSALLADLQPGCAGRQLDDRLQGSLARRRLDGSRLRLARKELANRAGAGHGYRELDTSAFRARGRGIAVPCDDRRSVRLAAPRLQLERGGSLARGDL